MAALLPGLILDPLDFTLWHWLVFASAVPGLAGGMLWAAQSGHWRAPVRYAAYFYLSVMGTRFFADLVGWQLDFVQLADALRFAFWIKGQQLMHPFSQGRLLEGLGLAFYEALMPAFQLIVAIGMSWARA